MPSLRYVLADVIGAGGMATIHLGIAGTELLAIKKLHANYASEPRFVAMLIDEARLAQHIRHPNVVATLDVSALAGEFELVMEYVHGPPLSMLLRTCEDGMRPLPIPIAGKIVCDVLAGLHAAHEARDARGVELGIVHRDVSPSNVLVGADGRARVLDFGIALSENRLQHTPSGAELRGKLSYMAPEQLSRGMVDRRADVYAASVVLWELLVGARLFRRGDEATTMYAVLSEAVPAPSDRRDDPRARALDEIVLRGLDRNPAMRFASAEEMREAIVSSGVAIATDEETAQWVTEAAEEFFVARTALVDRVRASAIDTAPPPAPTSSRWALVAGATALLLLTGAVAIGSRLARRAPSVVASNGAPASSGPIISSASSVPTPAITGEPVAASAALGPSPAKRPMGKVVRSGKQVPPDCATPYTIDERGFKRYKPTCL